jgi:predicted DCC family thiol-disulfide oxidoreductase YuxK
MVREKYGAEKVFYPYMPAKLYYERECRFCRRMAWWVYRRSPPGSLQLVATDYTDLGQLPLPVYSAFFVREGKVYALSDAVIEALAHARCGWLAALLRLIPRRGRDWLYRQVAARRSCAQGTCQRKLQ